MVTSFHRSPLPFPIYQHYYAKLAQTKAIVYPDFTLRKIVIRFDEIDPRDRPFESQVFSVTKLLRLLI